MKLHLVLFGLSVSALLSSGTIAGGSKYYAHVAVYGHPNATILVNNRPQGVGSAVFQVKRKDANKFALTIKEEGCESQNFKYKSRTFRGWALVGSIVTWTIMINGAIPLPVGVAVDLINGAYWKPSLFERGVSKMDYKHYAYNIEYTGCKAKEEKQPILNNPTPQPTGNSQEELIIRAKQKADQLREMKKLLDEGILTQEEYDKEKRRILDEK